LFKIDRKHPPFSIFGQNVPIYAFFSGKIGNFGNLTGVKDLTNSTSGWKSMSIIVLGKLRFPTNSQTTSDRI